MLQQIASHACFAGKQQIYQHQAKTVNCLMRFAIYLPAQAANQPLPVLYWLSGLTCNEQNFITKAGAQRYAAQHSVIIVAPDTSPRGEWVADHIDDDLGQGAGFYLNATQAPWATHYQMYDYIVKELPALIEAHFPVTHAKAISGHSMGGHGALTIALKNADSYCSVSAFAPIVAASQVAWGEKAFSAYLGEDRQAWLQYDAVALIAQASTKIPLLIEQGSLDPFLEQQLKTPLLAQACQRYQHPCTINYRTGYDHSYFFVASFIGEHIAYHAKALYSQ